MTTVRTLPTRRPARLPAALATLALAGVVLTGCGGGDDSGDDTDTPDSGSSQSVEDFVAEVDALCADLYPGINAAGASVDPADLSTMLDSYVPALQDLQDQLSDLTPPADVADEYAAVLQEQQDQLDAISADPNAIATLDPTDINATWDGLGATSCGSGSMEIAPAS